MTILENPLLFHDQINKSIYTLVITYTYICRNCENHLYIPAMLLPKAFLQKPNLVNKKDITHQTNFGVASHLLSHWCNLSLNAFRKNNIHLSSSHVPSQHNFDNGASVLLLFCAANLQIQVFPGTWILASVIDFFCENMWTLIEMRDVQMSHIEYISQVLCFKEQIQLYQRSSSRDNCQTCQNTCVCHSHPGFWTCLNSLHTGRLRSQLKGMLTLLSKRTTLTGWFCHQQYDSGIVPTPHKGTLDTGAASTGATFSEILPGAAAVRVQHTEANWVGFMSSVSSCLVLKSDYCGYWYPQSLNSNNLRSLGNHYIQTSILCVFEVVCEVGSKLYVATVLWCSSWVLMSLLRWSSQLGSSYIAVVCCSNKRHSACYEWQAV